jgi:hypothetical protein
LGPSKAKRTLRNFISTAGLFLVWCISSSRAAIMLMACVCQTVVRQGSQRNSSAVSARWLAWALNKTPRGS